MNAKTTHKSKRFLATLLVMAMALTMLPSFTLPAFAAEAPTTKWESNVDQAWYNNVMGGGYAADSFTISTAAEMAAFSKAVNAGKSFVGKTVTLVKDVDLSTHLWTPIGHELFDEESKNEFRGVFNGDGHSVILGHINVVSPTVSDFGLFGVSRGMEVKNLTVRVKQLDMSEATSGSNRVGAILGRYYAGNNYNSEGEASPLKLTNCHVKAFDSQSFLKGKYMVGGR